MNDITNLTKILNSLETVERNLTDLRVDMDWFGTLLIGTYISIIMRITPGI